jgi:hypothetical protein
MKKPIQRCTITLFLGAGSFAIAAILHPTWEMAPGQGIYSDDSRYLPDDQNPLRLFKPSGGLAGRIALEELIAGGVPITSQSARLAHTLLNSGNLTPDEKFR